MLHFFWTPFANDKFDYSIYELSNTEIAKYAKHYLSARIEFSLHSFLAGRVTDLAEDILLGHPTFHHPSLGWREGERANWVADNALQPGAQGHPNSYVMMPWLSTSPWNTERMPYLAQQLQAARLVFGMCGKFWYDRTMALADDSLSALAKHKLVQINVGCETRTLPQRVVPRSGVRKTFLHVSNLDDCKRPDLLFASIAGTGAELVIGSASMARGMCSFWLNDGRQVHFLSLGPFFNASDEFNRFVLENCDFYIHTSDADAQATAILENCARGLVPLVTPESGFACEYAVPLTLDAETNRGIIESAMAMSDAEYLARSHGARRHIEQHHAWPMIYDTVWREIERTATR